MVVGGALSALSHVRDLFHSRREFELVFTSNANALEPPKTPEQPPHTAERIPSGVTECRKINKKGCAKETEA